MLLAAEQTTLPVAEARAGDAQAWDALFRRFQMPLYVYIVELVRDEQTSLDIVQETFLSAVRHLRSLRNDEKFGSWLFSIAHQKIIQFWRRHRQVSFEEIGLEQAAGDPDPSELLIDKENQEKFLACLDRLPPSQRSIVLLHFVEEFSLDEIAEIAELPLGTVKSRLFYAKRALRRNIRKESS